MPEPSPIHATTVAIDGKGLLIRGPSGSGKTALAIELISLGAKLVADDRTIVVREGERIVARCPDTLRGLIEARHIGILNAPFEEECTITLVVDLSKAEQERLPPLRTTELAGQKVTLLYKGAGSAFAASIRHYILYGRNLGV